MESGSLPLLRIEEFYPYKLVFGYFWVYSPSSQLFIMFFDTNTTDSVKGHMQILVINLPDSTDRLKFQQEQLKRLGLDHEIIRAVSTNYVHEQVHYHLVLRSLD